MLNPSGIVTVFLLSIPLIITDAISDGFIDLLKLYSPDLKLPSYPFILESILNLNALSITDFSSSIFAISEVAEPRGITTETDSLLEGSIGLSKFMNPINIIITIANITIRIIKVLFLPLLILFSIDNILVFKYNKNLFT